MFWRLEHIILIIAQTKIGYAGGCSEEGKRSCCSKLAGSPFNLFNSTLPSDEEARHVII
jgi:hypothetical protein